MKRFLKLFTFLFLYSSLIYSEPIDRLFRFPAIHSNQIVFSYAGDLYTVAGSGGVARKLTSDIGYEMFPRFSPDGKWLAFTGQYDGNTEVYLMPSDGGVPKRLTYTATLDRDDVSDRMGPNNIVMTWRDDKTIIYRSRMIEFNDFKGKLFSASVDGGIPEQLPLPRGGWCSFSPDKKKMAYNRIFREFRTWKRYRGGQADDLSIYDFDTKKTENITNNDAQDYMPMWAGNKIYFNSDRDENKRLNIWCYDVTTKETHQVTKFTDYDVKFPSLGDNAIVLENGGYIYRLDLATEKYEKVAIQIDEDFANGRSKLIDVSHNISNYDISPDGNRALFGARGDVFTVPAKYGNTRNLTATSGVHERNSIWSPDGKWIAYISDASGEDEIYMQAQDGKSAAVRITTNGDNYKLQILWSPDSKKIMWADRKQHLYYVDVDSKKITDVAYCTEFEFTDYSWSPDSKWITYARQEHDVLQKVYIYSLDSKEATEITDGWFTSSAPAFSADGKYLFFVSDRSFNPISSNTEFNYAYFDMQKIFFVTLAKDTKSPFEPKTDEVKIKEESKNNDKSDDKKDDKKKDEKKKSDIKVDIAGIKSRIAVLPISAGNYYNLTALEGKVFYNRNGSKDEKSKLFVFDLEKQKETELGDYGSYSISADGKKMIVGADGAYAIVDLPTSKIEMKDRVNLADMKVTLDRQAEWMQMYNECWRQMRDYFFDSNMHGVDWKKVRDNYAPLVKYVNHRADLTYIIGEMIGEINCGHTYVGGGEYPKADRVKTGLLGAKLERDASSKYYKIKKILPGQNWESGVRSPLTDIGVNVNEGDYIIAVNGKSTKDMVDIYASLVNTVGKQVTLKVNAKPSEDGSHETVVIPIADEKGLYYYDWVQTNIDKVNKATGGKVGYIHIPDMGTNGLNQFVKYFYPQLTKEALIIDDRGNGGGNVSPQIAERLHRELAMIDISRNGTPNTNPGGMQFGPKVCLLDEFSASDGDIFPYRFKKYKIGTLIGKRSWGGVVGIRGSLPLLDGGFLNKPEFSRYDTDGKEWIMEGHGVDPDIVVDNDPAKEFSGEDEQLNKAIDVILEQLKTTPHELAKPPKYPDKHK